MDNATKLELMFSEMLETFESALELSGTMTITDIEKSMQDMGIVEGIEFLNDKIKNPYTTLKGNILKLEAEYEEYRNNPENIARAEKLMQALIDETTPILLTNGNEDDDDPTKH